MTPSPVRIAVLDDFQQAMRGLADWDRLAGRASVDFLAQNYRGQELVERLRDYDVLVGIRERTRFTGDLIRSLPRLRLLVSTGRRNLSLDLAACRAAGVTVCQTDSGSNGTPELTWALILGLARHIATEDAALRRGQWQTTMGTTLRGKVLGIVGLGKLGKEVARIGQAFGMEVIAWSRNLTEAEAARHGCRRVDKQVLFATADVVSVHVVLTEQTVGLVGAAEIAAMQPTALLVNTARAPVIDQPALRTALQTGAIAGCALDVFDEEPLPPDAAILTLPRTLLTPHLGYVTREGFTTYATQVLENIEAWLDGAPIRVA